MQVAGAELDRLRGHNSGELDPETVVSAARDEKSPLHSAFEWDDSNAAHAHRLQTAQLLIRSVLVVVSGASGSSPQRTRVTVTERPEAGAVTTKVISPEEMHRARVERGWKDLEDWHKQYSGLSEFTGVAAALSGFFAIHKAQQQAA